MTLVILRKFKLHACFNIPFLLLEMFIYPLGAKCKK